MLIKVFKIIIIIKAKFLYEPTKIIAIDNIMLMILNKVNTFSKIICLNDFVLELGSKLTRLLSYLFVTSSTLSPTFISGLNLFTDIPLPPLYSIIYHNFFVIV